MRVVEGGEAGVPAASALPSERMQRSFLYAPRARGEARAGNGGGDKPGAVMKEGEYS